MSPAPSPVHQQAVAEILVALHAYAREHGGAALPAPIDVVFSQTDATQPDVIYLATDRLSLIGATSIQGAPTLVVEVLSPSSSVVDPGRKLALYARHGVAEYWIVDPVTRAISAHAQPVEECYDRNVCQIMTIEALTLPGLGVSLAAL